AGEVFDVDVLVGVKGGRRAELAGTPSWDASGLIAEPFGEGKRIALGGGAAGVRFHTRAVAPQPGPVDVAPVQQDLRIQSTAHKRGSLFGRPDFDSLFDDDWDSFMPSFFRNAAMDDVTVTSDTAHLDVQPLPQPAPPGFTGAVGTFTL